MIMYSDLHELEEAIGALYVTDARLDRESLIRMKGSRTNANGPGTMKPSSLGLAVEAQNQSTIPLPRVMERMAQVVEIAILIRT